MIGNDEIVVVAQALDVNPPDVQRDYLFGWLLSGIYQGPLANQLVPKGGNALRKGYFANTRFSPDLDFATTGEIAVDALRIELTRITQAIHRETAVVFDLERLRVEPKNRVDKELKVLEARVLCHRTCRVPRWLRRRAGEVRRTSTRPLRSPCQGEQLRKSTFLDLLPVTSAERNS